MTPAGSELSIYQLVEALQWKLGNISHADAASCVDRDESENRSKLLRMIDAGKDIVGGIQDLYNSSQPINQLPPEILAHIFKAVQIRRNLTSFPPRPFGRDTKRANEWLRVTHVCRHWRRVALSTPSLWTNIVLSQYVTDFEGLNRWFLKNCGPLLLLSLDMHVQMVVEGERCTNRGLSPNFIDAFSSNFHRFESLVIHDFFGQMSSHSPHARLVQIIQQVYPLPVHLKRLCLPFYLNVSNRGAVDEIKRLTNHVTHFAFFDQEKQRHSITVQVLLDFLRSSPMLESLWIENAGPIVRRRDIRENMDAINMPYLRSVRYKDSSRDSDDASSFYWLITVIKVPEDAAVYLTSPLIPKALEYSTEMYQALSPFFERLSRVQILQETNSAGLIFHADRLYTKIPEHAYFYAAQDGPYSHVETIIFEDGRFHCMPARLRRLLKPFVNLRRMDVLWEYPYEFELNPLLETFNTSAKDQHPICPQLQEVGIRLKKKHLKGGEAVPVAMTREDTGGSYMIRQEEYRGADRSIIFSGCTLNDTFQLGGV